MQHPQVLTPELVKQLGRESSLIVLNWLKTASDAQLLALVAAPDKLEQEQGKAQILDKLARDLYGCINAKAN